MYGDVILVGVEVLGVSMFLLISDAADMAFTGFKPALVAAGGSDFGVLCVG